MNFKNSAACGLLALLLTIAGCGGGGSGGGIGGTGSASVGTLRLAITDAPACGYDAVNITIDRIRVNQSASAADADSGWSEIVLTPAKRVDLLSLSNGVLAELGQTSLPAGKYTQLRLVLTPNSATTPLANSVVPTGGSETALTTPSATESGLKLNTNIDVPADQIADFVLDFDACKSIVKRGNSGQYNLKPVISVIPRLSDAGMRVVGYLDPTLPAATTNVSLQLAGVPVKATPPDATGQFVLYPVPAGTYDLVISAAGRVTAVMTGVPVTTSAYTYVNAPATPIAPAAAASAPRSVAGTVAPATASVRALQLLNGGPTIEAAFAPVDATSGAFTFSLPVDAPRRAAYAAGVGAPAFTADPTAAAKYTIEAKSAGAVKTQAIDASAAVPALSFTFP
ncbi:MAG TPA: DUF4382 domain-containing protein [Burkholderiaceae bacterium]|nr:DUF4382 domain-containing protein [Burkholderiaceae bacterium]